uniref:Triadin n=1 Tax=Knipowitschia caucasica TaxID=637954 RepID=A0AAV2K8I8_KNICA
MLPLQFYLSLVEGRVSRSRLGANSEAKVTEPMGSQTKECDSAAGSSQRGFLQELVVTFSSPMAWLLMIALIITWLGVAIVLFDLLDYTTLSEYTSYCDDPNCLSPGRRGSEVLFQQGLPPPSSIGKRGIKARAARPLKAAVAHVTSEESSDWLQTLWAFLSGLVAPEDEEEGIQQLTDPFTSFHSEEL